MESGGDLEPDAGLWRLLLKIAVPRSDHGILEVMSGRWKERLQRMGEANERARQTETRRLTLNRAARILEGLLSNPPAPPQPRKDHPVSSGHRTRRKNV